MLPSMSLLLVTLFCFFPSLTALSDCEGWGVTNSGVSIFAALNFWNPVGWVVGIGSGVSSITQKKNCREWNSDGDVAAGAVGIAADAVGMLPGIGGLANVGKVAQLTKAGSSMASATAKVVAASPGLKAVDFASSVTRGAARVTEGCVKGGGVECGLSIALGMLGGVAAPISSLIESGIASGTLGGVAAPLSSLTESGSDDLIVGLARSGTHAAHAVHALVNQEKPKHPEAEAASQVAGATAAMSEMVQNIVP